MNQTQTDDTNTITLDDLDVQQTDEIKGGPSTQPKRDVILKTSIAAGTDEN